MTNEVRSGGPRTVFGSRRRSWYERDVQQKNQTNVEPPPAGLPADLLEILVCPKSKAPVVYIDGFLVCPTSRLKYRVEAGVPVMLVDEAEELSADAVEILMQQQRR
jgi:uncharacterized protein YbaR (Trm112 family)